MEQLDSQNNSQQVNIDNQKQFNINKMLEILRIPTLQLTDQSQIQTDLNTIEEILHKFINQVRKVSHLDQKLESSYKDIIRLEEQLKQRENQKQKLENELANLKNKLSLWEEMHQKELKKERDTKDVIKKHLNQMANKEKVWQFEMKKKEKSYSELKEQFNKVRKHQDSKSHEYYKINLKQITQIDNNQAQNNIASDILQEFIENTNKNYSDLASENERLREYFIRTFEKMQQSLLFVEKGIQEFQKYLQENGVGVVIEQVKFIELRSNVYGLPQQEHFEKAVEVMLSNFDKLVDKSECYRQLVKQALDVQKQGMTRTPVHSDRKQKQNKNVRNSVQSQISLQDQQILDNRLDSLMKKMYKMQCQIQMQNEFIKQLLEVEPRFQGEIEEFQQMLIQVLEEKNDERQGWRESIQRIELMDNSRIIKEGQVVETQLRELKIQQEEINKQQ